MAIKNIFKLLSIFILIIAILNCAYANAGPEIGPNQAKTIAQDYLNSHNLNYIAATPGWDAWKFYVKDTQTGEKKWITFDTAWSDMPDIGGPGRYKDIPSIFNNEFGVWFVKVNDKNGKNAGQLYIDDTTGKVLKVAISQKSKTKKSQTNISTPTNTTNVTNPTNMTNTTIPVSSGSSGDNTGIIFGMIILIMALSAGYFMYTRM